MIYIKNQKPIFLAVDIGNTNIAFGVFPLHSSAPLKVFRIGSHEPQGSHRKKLLSLLRQAKIDDKRIQGVAIASVVPALDRTFKNLCERLLHQRPLFIGHRIETGVKILVDKPSQVGADRIVNACAAHQLFGKKAVVVDFGTATTFDCVSQRGEYLGGLICPGPALAAKALATQTAKLPFVNLAKPRRVIGKNTVDCIRSGLFFGYIGVVREILKRVQTEMGGGALVLATGGDADLIAPHLPEIDRVMPNLTLQGIKMIWELNLKCT